MKLTNAQLKELRETGKVEFPMGTIKRIEQRVDKYYDVGAEGFVHTKKKVVVKHIFSLNKDFLTYLRVKSEEF